MRTQGMWRNGRAVVVALGLWAGVACSGSAWDMDRPRADCIGTCEVFYNGPMACSEFQAELRSAIGAIEVHDPDVCTKVNRWLIEVRDVETLGANGRTRCDVGVMYIPPSHSTLRHELMHAIECPWTDETHNSWSWQWDVE